MPEGDALHRAAERLRVLEGEVVAVETPHPRAALLGLAERIDGRRLERVEAVGKNLLLDFEGGLVLRSHLRMHGRWRVRARGRTSRLGMPWLVLRGRERQAVLWNGPVLELTRGRVADGGAARAGHHGRPARPRRDARAAPRTPSSRARWARPSSTSASSPGSGTSGRPRRSSRPGSRRGAGCAEFDDGELRPCSPRRPRLMQAGRTAHRRLPPSGRPVPAVRHDEFGRARRATRRGWRTGARRARQERARRGRNRSACPTGLLTADLRRRNGKASRSPLLCTALRGFCLGAFFELGLELEGGADIPVALEEHAGPNRPTLYEYRPLVGSFVELRAGRIGAARGRTRGARGAEGRAGRRDLRAAPTQTSASARTRRCAAPSSSRCSSRTAEACGGFDWDDAAFERAYAELERSLFGDRRSYAALWRRSSA